MLESYANIVKTERIYGTKIVPLFGCFRAEKLVKDYQVKIINKNRKS